MGIAYRVATEDDFAAMCDFDGAVFGSPWEADERSLVRPTLDLDRFVLAHDGAELVGVASLRRVIEIDRRRTQVTAQWHDGHPAHEVQLYDVVAATGEAHAALWHTILSLDLVGPIRSHGAVSVDDSLAHLLEDPRALRTTDLNDMMWLRLGDPTAALAARTYATDDQLVVDVGDERFTIDGSPEGATVRRGTFGRRRADLTIDPAGMGAMYLGGVAPSTLVRARRADAKDERSLRRADVFFSADRAPHCSTGF